MKRKHVVNRTWEADLRDDEETGETQVVIRCKLRTHDEDGAGREYNLRFDWEEPVVQLPMQEAAWLAMSIVDCLGYVAKNSEGGK